MCVWMSPGSHTLGQEGDDLRHYLMDCVDVCVRELLISFFYNLSIYVMHDIDFFS